MVTDLQEQIDKMTPDEYRQWRVSLIKEYEELGIIDYGLYDVLIALNKRGFSTCSSCAGHTRGERGSISFARYQEIKGRNLEDLLWILQRYGLKDIELKTKGKYTLAVSFVAIEGSQYRRYTDDMPLSEDTDYRDSVPPRPESCPTCGKSDFWLQGEMYDIDDTLEWMCKNCQPLSFDNNNRAFVTPEIAKRRADLPKLKVWEVEDTKAGKTFLVGAKNEFNIYLYLGCVPGDDDWDYFRFNIKRVK